MWLEAVPQHYVRGVAPTRSRPENFFGSKPTLRGAAQRPGGGPSLRRGETAVAGTEALGVFRRNSTSRTQALEPIRRSLYDAGIALVRNGRTLDEVRSYAAMRKFSRGRDRSGVMRLLLSTTVPSIRAAGPGLVALWAAPYGSTDEALAFERGEQQGCGFNMIRKSTSRWSRPAGTGIATVWE